MKSWKMILAVPIVGGLFAAGCFDDDEDYGNLLTEPGLYDDSEILGAVPIQVEPVLRVRGPSSASPAARGYEWDPDNPDPELNFHVVRGPTQSYEWHGQHQSTGAKASTYTDDVNGGNRHEHISSGMDQSLFKPYGSEHIADEESGNHSLYE